MPVHLLINAAVPLLEDCLKCLLSYHGGRMLKFRYHPFSRHLECHDSIG